jgi:2-phosphosulfolactate phosphatase
MKIKILQLIYGAKQALGFTVIIDVFRAFSTACYVMENGADRIITTAGIETAYHLKNTDASKILMGERHERMLPGFDYGNSPAAIKEVDFTGKTVILTTSAGTQGIINASNADEIITGSFVNAAAIIKYIRDKAPQFLSLVCMGYGASRSIEEDNFFAEYIINELTGQVNNFEYMVSVIRKTSGRRFFLPENIDHSPPEDFDLCLSLNRFNFILKAVRVSDDQYELKKYQPE